MQLFLQKFKNLQKIFGGPTHHARAWAARPHPRLYGDGPAQANIYAQGVAPAQELMV